MGQVSTEQTVRIIEAVGDAMPESTQTGTGMGFWPLLLIAVIPVIIAPFAATWWQKRRKK